MTVPPAKQALLELRAVRNAARRLVTDDVAYVRSDAAKRGWIRSAGQMGGDYLTVMGEGALDLAKSNRGKVAGGVALAVTALAAWAFRDQIADALVGALEDDPDADPLPDTDTSPTL
jgi:hypothetical protein